jgi:hypothetical protein
MVEVKKKKWWKGLAGIHIATAIFVVAKLLGYFALPWWLILSPIGLFWYAALHMSMINVATTRALKEHGLVTTADLDAAFEKVAAVTALQIAEGLEQADAIGETKIVLKTEGEEP